MGHIFISYSHKDKKYVEKLEKKLIAEGFDVWIDHRIDYGDDWLRVIEKNLDESDAFIIVMSKNSKASNMVQNEITRARDTDKTIFPVLLDGENWLVVQRKQYIDVRDGSLPPEKFYKRLRGIVSIETGIQKSKKLLRDVIQTWVEFDVLPSAELLFVLWNELDHQSLTKEEMAFLYCAYYSQLRPSEEWIEDNEFFSFDGYLDKLILHQNSFSPILRTFAFVSVFRWGMSSSLDGSYDVIFSKILVKVDNVETPAMYFLITEGVNQCLEMLLLQKENGVEAFIMYSARAVQEIIDIFYLEIDKINTKSLSKRLRYP